MVAQRRAQPREQQRLGLAAAALRQQRTQAAIDRLLPRVSGDWPEDAQAAQVGAHFGDQLSQRRGVVAEVGGQLFANPPRESPGCRRLSKSRS